MGFKRLRTLQSTSLRILLLIGMIASALFLQAQESKMASSDAKTTESQPVEESSPAKESQASDAPTADATSGATELTSNRSSKTGSQAETGSEPKPQVVKKPRRPMAPVAKSRVVDLEWEPVEDAMKYEVQFSRLIKDKQRKEPVNYFVEESSWKGRLMFGLYKMRLRSYDDRGIPGDWTDEVDLVIKVLPPKLVGPKRGRKLKSGETSEKEVAFRWKKSTGASSYQVNLRDQSGEIRETINADETTLTTILPVGKRYYWNVTPIMVDGSPGELPKKEETFVLLSKAPDPVEIQKPISKFVRTLTWSNSSRATYYKYALYFKKGKKWKRIERSKNFTETSINFDLSRPTGMYKLVVRPYAPLSARAKLSKIIFPVQGDLRSPAAVEQAVLKESIEKPKDFYFIASYFITLMNITGGDSQSQFRLPDTIGGTGRLGVGWQQPDRPFGVFGILDLSGFNISSENYTFGSIEVHGTYKRYWGSNQILLSGGVFTKELPMVLDDGIGNFTGVKIHQNTGPHAGFKIWRPFNNKIGAQINGRIYFNVAGNAPSGETIEPSFSHQIGLLGTYRLRENLMGFAGYAHRKDVGSFQSPTGSIPDNITTITVEGHYLNFVLEYAF